MGLLPSPQTGTVTARRLGAQVRPQTSTMPYFAIAATHDVTRSAECVAEKLNRGSALMNSTELAHDVGP